MNTKQTTETEAQGAHSQIQHNEEYWINEFEYFMDACEGLNMSYAILKRMADHAKSKIEEINPSYKFEE